MTKEEMKKIIRENQDKSLNELKRTLKNNMEDKEQREKFSFDDLMQLIIEINQEREKEIQKVSSKRPKNTRKKEGEER